MNFTLKTFHSNKRRMTFIEILSGEVGIGSYAQRLIQSGLRTFKTPLPHTTIDIHIETDILMQC